MSVLFRKKITNTSAYVIQVTIGHICTYARKKEEEFFYTREH